MHLHRLERQLALPIKPPHGHLDPGVLTVDAVIDMLDPEQPVIGHHPTLQKDPLAMAVLGARLPPRLKTVQDQGLVQVWQLSAVIDSKPYRAGGVNHYLRTGRNLPERVLL